MDVAILFVLCVIAVLLFYRLVERKHKVLLAKVLGGCALAAGLVTATLAWNDLRTERTAAALKTSADSVAFAQYLSDMAALSVVYLPDSTRNFTQRTPVYELGLGNRSRLDTMTHVGFRVCNVAADTIDAAKVRAWTWLRGHSSRQPLLSNGDPVTTDQVIAPHSCRIAVFEGHYTILDSVAASAMPQWRPKP